MEGGAERSEGSAPRRASTAAIEAQYVLEVYDTATSLYEDYLEMVLQVC